MIKIADRFRKQKYLSTLPTEKQKLSIIIHFVLKSEITL